MRRHMFSLEQQWPRPRQCKGTHAARTLRFPLDAVADGRKHDGQAQVPCVDVFVWSGSRELENRNTVETTTHYRTERGDGVPVEEAGGGDGEEDARGHDDGEDNGAERLDGVEDEELCCWGAESDSVGLGLIELTWMDMSLGQQRVPVRWWSRWRRARSGSGWRGAS